MDESLRKFENRPIKISRVNSILLITKSIILQLIYLILYGSGVRCHVIFKLTASAQFINREVYARTILMSRFPILGEIHPSIFACVFIW